MLQNGHQRDVQLCRGGTRGQQHPRSPRVRSARVSGPHPLPGRLRSTRRINGDQSQRKAVHGTQRRAASCTSKACFSAVAVFFPFSYFQPPSSNFPVCAVASEVCWMSGAKNSLGHFASFFISPILTSTLTMLYLFFVFYRN